MINSEKKVLERVREMMSDMKGEILEVIKDTMVDSTVDRMEDQMKELVAEQMRGVNVQLTKKDEDQLVDRLRRRLNKQVIQLNTFYFYPFLFMVYLYKVTISFL